MSSNKKEDGDETISQAVDLIATLFVEVIDADMEKRKGDELPTNH